MAEGAPQGVGTEQAWPGGGQGKGPHPPAEDTWRTLSHRACLQGQQSCMGPGAMAASPGGFWAHFVSRGPRRPSVSPGQEPPCSVGGGAEGQGLGAPRLPTASAPSTPLNGAGVS